MGNRSVFTPKRETLIHFSPLEKPKTHRVALMNAEGIPVSRSLAEDRCAVLKEKIEPKCFLLEAVISLKQWQWRVLQQFESHPAQKAVRSHPRCVDAEEYQALASDGC